MIKYKFLSDFSLPNAPSVLFKKGDVIDYDDNLIPSDARKDGIYYVVSSPTSSSVVFIPFAYLEAMPNTIDVLKKSSIPYIVMGILVVGFISYKLYKKYS
jgi:hypothetical protein